MIIGIGFVLLLLIGVPIAFVLGLTGVIHMYSTGNYLLFNNVAQRMFTGIDTFSLMAVPLFILAGDLMNSGGLTVRLVNFARALIGHLRGGLAYVSIMVSMFMAAIVGSATAVTALQCNTLVPEMVRDDYEEDFAVAVATGSSIMGPIIPPSMFFVVYGVVAGVSIGGLFIGGVIPGVLLGLSMMVVAYFYIKKKGYPVKPRASLRTLGKVTVEALPALLLPLIIMGGILSGVFTPTECGGAAVFVALIVGFFVYRELTWKKIPKILGQTAITTASILLVVATANIFGWTLAIEQIPQKIAQLMLSISTNKYVLLFIINIFLLIVGCIMEAFAAIVILVPVFKPIIAQLGIDPLHFGMVVCFNLIVGMITPPVGLCLFVASSITKLTIEKITRAIFPFICVSVVVLLLVTYLPTLSVWLPRLFKLH
ncbi:MAG: TRAP transporter large permease [Bacillota bacterium]